MLLGTHSVNNVNVISRLYATEANRQMYWTHSSS